MHAVVEVVRGRDHGQCGPPERCQRRLRIEGHHGVETAHHGLPWRRAQVVEESLEHRAVRARDAAPVALDRFAVGGGLDGLEERADLRLRGLGAVADRIREHEMGDPARLRARIRQRHACAEAVPHEGEALQPESVGHRAHVQSVSLDRVLVVPRRVGPAVPPEVERHRPPALAHVLELRRPLGDVARQGVQKHHGGTRATIVHHELARGSGDAAAHPATAPLADPAQGGRSRRIRRCTGQDATCAPGR